MTHSLSLESSHPPLSFRRSEKLHQSRNAQQANESPESSPQQSIPMPQTYNKLLNYVQNVVDSRTKWPEEGIAIAQVKSKEWQSSLLRDLHTRLRVSFIDGSIMIHASNPIHLALCDIVGNEIREAWVRMQQDFPDVMQRGWKVRCTTFPPANLYTCRRYDQSIEMEIPASKRNPIRAPLMLVQIGWRIEQSVQEMDVYPCELVTLCPDETPTRYFLNIKVYEDQPRSAWSFVWVLYDLHHKTSVALPEENPYWGKTENIGNNCPEDNVIRPTVVQIGTFHSARCCGHTKAMANAEEMHADLKHVPQHRHLRITELNAVKRKATRGKGTIPTLQLPIIEHALRISHRADLINNWKKKAPKGIELRSNGELAMRVSLHGFVTTMERMSRENERLAEAKESPCEM